MSNFKKGDAVEVSKDNNGESHFFYYPASVVRPPSKNKNLVFVEYLTLLNPSSESTQPNNKRLKEYVNVANVRPKLPHQLNPWFKVGDSVDAYRQSLNAWCPATVTDILENSNYLVAFRGPNHDSETVEQCCLRLHRDWLRSEWVPPLPQHHQQEKPPEMVTNPENLRFKIKYSRKPQKEFKFKKGEIVEVSSDEEGYKGSWYVATIIGIIGKDKFLVEYRDLTTDDGTQLLKEETNAGFIRPCPPEVPFVGSFKRFQEVDAWYNDGWWEGVVLELLNSSECFVRFMHNDVLKFENSKLRSHQDWFDGKWVMSSKKSSELVKKFGDEMPKAKKLNLNCQKPSEHAKKPTDVMTRSTNTGSKFVLHFCKGANVEVRSDEEGYQGSWYTASVVEFLQNGKYLVEYLTLKTDDLTEQLKEEANASDMRPYPPDINHVHQFVLREMVDAWYNDGWWVGQVSSVLHGFKYRVYFWPTKEELEFEHCHLRPHQEWIDGRWVLASLSTRPNKRLKEYVNVANVRPKLPHQLNPWFKVGDSVGAYHQSLNAWCPATVTDILKNSNYLVAFHGSDHDSEIVEQCCLRLHWDWLRGEWVPPLPHQHQQEKPPEMVTNPENLRFKIKYSRKPRKESEFKKGEIVEVSSDEEGYKGAWYVATIIDNDIIGKDRFLVEFRDLTTEDGTQLLKEETDVRFIRPCPPEVPSVGSFKRFQEVEAWYNDGWWEGVVLELLNSRECFVHFMHNDVLKIENSKLRPHQEWFDGKWLMSSKKSSELVKKFGDEMPKAKNLTGAKLISNCQKPSEHAKKPTDLMTRSTNNGSKFGLHFCKGAKVEVRSDEGGYLGAWYTATVVDFLQNGKYLVEYLTLKTDDLAEQLKEEADASDMRPYPPDINHVHQFVLREMVDAWYNDGWWVGQVSGVLHGFKYRVYFWPTKEELEFEHCHLRPHQEWIDGRWVLASLVCNKQHIL